MRESRKHGPNLNVGALFQLRTLWWTSSTGFLFMYPLSEFKGRPWSIHPRPRNKQTKKETKGTKETKETPPPHKKKKGGLRLWRLLQPLLRHRHCARAACTGRPKHAHSNHQVTLKYLGPRWGVFLKDRTPPTRRFPSWSPFKAPPKRVPSTKRHPRVYVSSQLRPLSFVWTIR